MALPELLLFIFTCLLACKICAGVSRDYFADEPGKTFDRLCGAVRSPLPMLPASDKTSLPDSGVEALLSEEELELSGPASFSAVEQIGLPGHALCSASEDLGLSRRASHSVAEELGPRLLLGIAEQDAGLPYFSSSLSKKLRPLETLAASCKC